MIQVKLTLRMKMTMTMITITIMRMLIKMKGNKMVRVRWIFKVKEVIMLIMRTQIKKKKMMIE